MAAPRFLQKLAGGFQEVVATVLGGAGNGEKIVSTNVSGLLDISLFPAGIGADVVTVPASEALAAGAAVNLWTNAGATNARNADASTATGGKKLDGFVIAAVASGASATVYRNGLNTGLSGLTPGADYYLGTTAGTFTATPPSAAGQTLQYAGKAITATSLDVQPGPFVGLA